MFSRLAHMVVHNPWKVISAWVIALVVFTLVSPSLSDVVNSDQTSFLPSSYESVQAMDIARQLFPNQSATSATFVFKRADGRSLTAKDSAMVSMVADSLQASGIPSVHAVLTDSQQVAPNRRVQLAQVVFDGSSTDKPVVDAVSTLRTTVSSLLQGSDLKAGLTGDAAFSVDSNSAFSRAETIVSIATIVLIIVLLGIIFRSPVAALLPIVAAGLVYTLATSVIALVAKTFHFQIADMLTSLLIVVLFGVGTDYVVFLLFRYRERLRHGVASREALTFAAAKVGEVIASSALTVVVAFGALYLSKLADLRAMAPGFVIAVSLMLLGGLTLVPAILSLVGPKVFWPSRRWQQAQQNHLATRASHAVARHPGRMALIAGGLLSLLAAGSLFYHANYDMMSSMPQNQESTTAYNDLKSSFPAGALNPTQVYVSSRSALAGSDLARLSSALKHTEGVAMVFPPALAPDSRTAALTVYLKDGPYSDAALDAVDGPIRNTAHHPLAGDRVLIGGTTSAFVDVRAAINRDLSVIFPSAALLIAVILIVLLRSLVAPLYLLGAVALGYAATLGSSVGVFQGLSGEHGLIFSLPIVMYLFVVALGTDYNILTTARLREEFDAGHDCREAARRTVQHTMPTVAAAGVILAGTFASLMLSGIGSLMQIGFAVSVGIALAAFVMAAVLVPSVAALLGRRIWWPRQVSAAPSSRAARLDESIESIERAHGMAS
jgi:RND superfamily putative drug exporter